MTSIEVERMGVEEFRVTISDQAATTVHHVMATLDDVHQLAGEGIEPERLVEATIEFLLSHEPRSMIAPDFELSSITRLFPEYPFTIRAKLAA